MFENTIKVFVDPEFPPSNESVAAENEELAVHWRRPVEFMESGLEIELFSKLIEPKDIRSGPLSKQWFLCAVATLAERPELVRKLF